MTETQLEAFLRRHPRLYHFAEIGAWESIRANGLLSTSALLDLYRVEGEARFALESARRDGMSTLKKEGLPHAVIRDQKPLSDASLRDCLPPDISPRNWYELLNGKVFFWLSKDRLNRMARTYGDKRRLVLALDSAALVAAYTDDIWLSHMNSGCSIPWKAERSYETFRRIADYPYGKRRGTAAELCVDHSVPNVQRFVDSVHEVCGARRGRVVWER